MHKYTLGIDLHKESSVWVLIDDKYNEIWNKSVKCRPLNITTALRSMPVSPLETKVAIEPVCGWRWVSSLIEEEGAKIHYAHPYKVRLIAESTQKHDHGDARMLAGLLHSGYFPESRKVSEETYNLRLLMREREFLVRMRTRAKNRLRGIATTRGCIYNPLHKSTKDKTLEYIPEISRELFALIEELNGRIKPLDELIEDRAKKDPLASILMSMPTIGIITALTIIAEVEDFNRFSTAGKLASYAGLVPRQRSSGNSSRFGSITNQGSKRLRTAMVEAAMRVKKDSAPELYSVVERISPKSGAKRARVALARKMLTILWTMAKNNTAYNAELLSSARAANVSDLDTKLML